MEKVGEKTLTEVAADGFGMKLNPFNGQRLVPQAHDFPVRGPGGYFQHLGHRRRIHCKAVVSGESAGAGKVAEYPFAVHLDGLNFAVHDVPGLDDHTAEGLRQALVSKTDSQNGDAAGKGSDGLNGNPCFPGRTGAGGYDEAARVQGFEFGHGHFVISDNLHFLVRVVLDDVADHLVDVVGEGIVVVDEDDHFAKPPHRRQGPAL